jgi:predicted dehydrogenase
MRPFDRRDFLKSSLSTAGLFALAAGANPLQAEEPEKPSSRSGDVNSRIRVAVIGVRGQGGSHVSGYTASKFNTEVAAICDVDEGVIGPRMKLVEEKQGKAPKYYKDIRKLLEDKSIDAVSIATPNHWHALAAIWAMQHGKDVYVEKPVSHNVREGRIMVETARKLGKICQTGTQSRSNLGMRQAIEYVHSGKIGKLNVSYGTCYKRRGSIGKVDGPQDTPKTLDYNLWCGPAQVKPLMRKNLHYDWHWVWETGNGDLGNQGIHEMDKARWGLAKNHLPNSVFSLGGRFGYIDDGETANTQLIVFDYSDSSLIFEVRGLASTCPYPGGVGADKKGANYVGNIFYGTNGIVVCPNYSGGVALDGDGKVVAKFGGGGNHFENFIKAVRSRKQEDLNADILEGHLSSALCHLGNISYRLGGEQAYDAAKSSFGDNKEAAQTLARMTEHLKDNNVALDKTPYRVGRKLMIDAKTETFLGDKQANAMLFREYRKGFEVPDKV